MPNVGLKGGKLSGILVHEKEELHGAFVQVENVATAAQMNEAERRAPNKKVIFALFGFNSSIWRLGHNPEALVSQFAMI